MRPIGYVAAAAAGMFVPVAFALPAVAATPSLSSVSSIVGTQDGSDDFNNDDNFDGNFDRDFDDNRNNGADFQGSVDIVASSSETTGDVSLLVVADDLNPRTQIELNSPALDAACEDISDLDDTTGTADRNGYLSVSAEATNCVPGTYRISVSELDSPFQTASEEVTID